VLGLGILYHIEFYLPCGPIRHPNLTIGHSMAELSSFARGLLAAASP